MTGSGKPGREGESPTGGGGQRAAEVRCGRPSFPLSAQTSDLSIPAGLEWAGPFGNRPAI